MTHKQRFNVYFAACAPDGGVYHCTLDDGRLTLVKKYPLDRPMYLCADGGRLYVLLREPFAGSDDSGLMSFAIAPDGSLSGEAAVVSTGGRCACHLSASAGKIYAANYLSGNVVAIGASGVDASVQHTGQGVHPTRQEAAHTHFVRVSPDGRYIFAVDLGVDTIFTYDHALSFVSAAKVPDGEGCRHLDYHLDGRYVYCANELGSSVTVFAYADGRLERLGTTAVLPSDFTGESTVAAIRVSRDGKTLYVSNRGHDSICALDILDGALLANPVWTKVSGESPRDFILADDILLATNERTNNVTLFRVTGKHLIKLDTELTMPGPLCVIALKA